MVLGWNLAPGVRGILDGMADAFGMKVRLVSPDEAGQTVAQLLGEVPLAAARTLRLEPGAIPRPSCWPTSAPGTPPPCWTC